MALRELPFRDTEDSNYNPNNIEINNELEATMYQLQLVMLTNRGEVLGDSSFGSNLEDQLFTFNANEYTINTTLTQQTNLYVLLANKYNIKFSTRFVKEGYHDVGLIDVAVDGNSAFGLLFQ